MRGGFALLLALFFRVYQVLQLLVGTQQLVFDPMPHSPLKPAVVMQSGALAVYLLSLVIAGLALVKCNQAGLGECVERTDNIRVIQCIFEKVLLEDNALGAAVAGGRVLASLESSLRQYCGLQRDLHRLLRLAAQDAVLLLRRVLLQVFAGENFFEIIFRQTSLLRAGLLNTGGRLLPLVVVVD